MRVRVDSDRVLEMLLEQAQFSIARSYASIVGSTANEVTVKEVSIPALECYTVHVTGVAMTLVHVHVSVCTCTCTYMEIYMYVYSIYVYSTLAKP